MVGGGVVEACALSRQKLGETHFRFRRPTSSLSPVPNTTRQPPSPTALLNAPSRGRNSVDVFAP
jgi:hypothetical protein